MAPSGHNGMDAMTVEPCRTVKDTAQQARALTALKAMPHRTRIIFVLHCFEGWCYSRIAEHLGLTSRQVEKAMCRALARLHRSLGEI